MPTQHWAILTGEYHAPFGGVSAYTHQLATALAAAGDRVHIWAPVQGAGSMAAPGVTVHPLPDHFGMSSLRLLGRELGQLPRPRRILVQYVPHAFGWKAMNLPFCLWLAAWRRDGVWVMFHEVAFPVHRGQPLRHNVLGYVTRMMAYLVARRAERIFVSTPAWGPLLRRIAPGAGSAEWLPVPSGVSTTVTEPGSELRAALPADAVVVGHFGTYGVHVAPLIAAALPPILRADPCRVALLMGRGSSAFARRLQVAHPELTGRIHTADAIPPQAIAGHLAVCDVVLQPYPEGVTTRRTTTMAALALGRPVVTTEGPLTEPLWRESGAVALAPAGSNAALVSAVEAVLATADRRAELGARAAVLYENQFALAHVVSRLRA